jgi:hypothetical protein
MKNAIGLLLTRCTLVLGAAGCAPTGTFISSNLENLVVPHSSEAHRIEYVRVEQKPVTLTLYGKLDHTHKPCLEDGHIDVAFLDAAGQTLKGFSLSIVNRGNRGGWVGATFRTRLKYVLPVDARIVIAMHDESCRSVDDPWTCEANRAMGK